MSEYVKVGHTKKPHGIKGELKIVIEDAFLEDVLEASVIFLEIGAGMVPCFPASYRDVGSLLIKFDGMDDREAIAPMVGRPVYLREEDLRSGVEAENDLQLQQLTG